MLSIRKASVFDISTLHHFAFNLINDVKKIEGIFYLELLEKINLNKLIQSISHGDFFLLLLKDNNPIGYIYIQIKQSHILNFYIVEQYRNLGYGKKIFQSILNNILINKKVTVNALTSSIGFYKKLGFFETGIYIDKGNFYLTNMLYKRHS